MKAWDIKEEVWRNVACIDFAGIVIRKGEPSYIERENDGCFLIKDSIFLYDYDKCPLCGSTYFGNYEKDSVRTYYCKGQWKEVYNEYNGCDFKWRT